MQGDRRPLLLDADGGGNDSDAAAADDIELQPIGPRLGDEEDKDDVASADVHYGGGRLPDDGDSSAAADDQRHGFVLAVIRYLISAGVVVLLIAFFFMLVDLDKGLELDAVANYLIASSDASIALFYFFIPGAMFAVVLQRGDLGPYVWAVLMFGAFTVCCGLTHLISALAPWADRLDGDVGLVWRMDHQLMWLMAAMKVITAVISYTTVIAVYKIIPLALLIPSPVQLEREINERKAAQGKLQSRFERSLVTSRVTREIRSNLQLRAICRSTAERCADLFGADRCTLYRHKARKQRPPHDEHDGQEAAPRDARADEEDEIHEYLVLSEHRRRSRAGVMHAGYSDGSGGDERDDVDDGDLRQCEPAPPLHLLPSLDSQQRAIVIDVERGLAVLSEGDDRRSELALELVDYYRGRGVAWVMCVAVPYRTASTAVIVLEAAAAGDVRRSKWTMEDVEQLEEISAQVEVGLAHAHLLEEAERGRRLTELNSALTQAKAAAEAASTAKSQFLAIVSHEIRTPMNAICGMTKVLKDSHMSSEQRECVEIVSSSAKALLSLLNNILDFSKIEANKTDILSSPFDIRACTDNVMGLMVNYQAGKLEHRVALSTLIDSRIPNTVIGDRDRLRQVLVNLLSNALKFTQSGSVTIRVTLHALQTDPADSTSASAIIRFEVSDTGIGIPQEKLDRLFHPFSQVDSGLTRKYEGTGLGLAISMRLCEKMGGSMWVQSHEGRGSTFGFDIRVRVGNEDPISSSHEPNDAHDIVEDDGGGLMHGDASARWPPSSSSTSAATVEPMSPPRYHRKLYSWRSRSLSTGVPSALTLASSTTAGAGLASDAESSPLNASLYRPKSLSATRRSSPLRLLLAEDNLVNQKVAFKLLSRLGFYNVEAVSNGKQAISSIKSQTDGQPFDIVLMDLHMPEMDGITASRIIKQDLRDKAPYIIACTADLQYDTRSACAQAGIDNYLEKPLKLKDLARVLESVVSSRVTK